MTLELTTAALFLLSTFYGGLPSRTSMSSAPSQDSAADVVIAMPSEESVQPFTLEQYVRLYFRDTPILVEVARCESNFRHLETNGQILRGEVVSEDVGIMQINEFYHTDDAKTLGIDLHTLDGNLAYAKWLYGKEGIVPWYSSSKCWKKTDTLATRTTVKTSGKQI